MDNNKKIAKALLEKNYADAKEHVFNALYAKASLLLDEQRVAVAEAVFNEDKAMGMYSDGDDEDKKETKKKTKNQKPSMYEEAEDDKAAKTKTASKKGVKAKGPVGPAVESDGY
jgi:hypothetical protein